jgi:tellurite resistance protein
MEKLKKSTLIKLRDKLTERGQRASAIPAGNLPTTALELLRVSTEYGPLCEVMYLIMAADGRVLSVERDVLKGAMKTLTDDQVSSVHIEALLDAATRRLASDGYEARLKGVIEILQQDPVRAEVAFVLAASVAYADDEMDARENVTLTQMAQGLGLDDAKVATLIEEVERELK